MRTTKEQRARIAGMKKYRFWHLVGPDMLADLEDALAQNIGLREALMFYADIKHWTERIEGTTACEDDAGCVAIHALKETK